MKPSFLPFCWCAFTLIQPLRADFEKWTRADGKAAELDLVDVKEANGETTAEFETRAGKKLSLKLDQLAENDRLRVGAWKPGTNVKTKFKGAETQVFEGRPETTLLFDLQSKGFLDVVYDKLPGEIVVPGRPQVLRFTLGGEPVKFQDCMATLDRDPFEGPKDEDPFAGGKLPKPNVDGAGVLRVHLRGTPEQLKAQDCEFEGKFYYRFVGQPKEIEGMIETSTKVDDPKFQQLGPYKVALKPWALWDQDKETEQQAIDKRGPDGYSVVISEDSDKNLVLGTWLMVGSKRVEGGMAETKAAPRFKVVLKHWSVVRELPFIVTKAAGEKGR